MVDVAIISCDFILKNDTNYQHFNYLNHILVSYFGEKMSYRYCARRMQYYYMLSATVSAITSLIHPTSMSINYDTFHNSGTGQDIKFTKDMCSRLSMSLFSWISHINWSCNHTMLYSANGNQIQRQNILWATLNNHHTIK